MIKRKEPHTTDPLAREAQRYPLPGYKQLSLRLHELGWTDGTLARLLGDRWSRSFVNHVRLGRREATPEFKRDSAVVLARALGIDADLLRVELYGIEEPQLPQRTSVFTYPEDTEVSHTDQEERSIDA